jgi:hypothetical protein
MTPRNVSDDEQPVGVYLLAYAPASFAFSTLCGLLGKTYHPLAAYQVYALACAVWFALGCVVFRPKRLWPPTKGESLSALASNMILTAESLALMLPSSLVTVVAGKAGCLLIPDPTDKRAPVKKYALAAIAGAAVVMASLGKPLRVLLLPSLLAAIYTMGFAVKSYAVRPAKDRHTAKGGYLSAGQAVVMALTLSVASGFSHIVPSAPLGDWRLWAVALASLACGLLGTRLMLHRTRQGAVFPSYRALSLVCALGASAARGEALHWSGWVAVGLAAIVVLWVSAERWIIRMLVGLTSGRNVIKWFP